LDDLHAFGDLDAEKCHAVLQNLGHVASQHEAHGFLLLVGFVEDAVVVIELVEDLGEFVAVVGNARWALVLTCLTHS
jgi:hypothetical protein